MRSRFPLPTLPTLRTGLRRCSGARRPFGWSAGLVCASLGASAPAQGAIEPQGRLIANAYVPYDFSDTRKLVQADFEAWLSGAYAPSESWSLQATGVLRQLIRPLDQLDPTTRASSETAVKLREGYVRYSRGSIDVQAGQILIPWGKADAINPTDFLSAKDFRIANPDEEVRRIGPTAFTAALTPRDGSAPITFRGVFVPRFARSRLLIPASLIPDGAVIEDPAPAPQTNSFEEFEYALQVAYSGSGWDASLSGFTGWNHVPDLGSGTLQGTTVFVEPEFQRLQGIGGDVSVSAGAFVIRAEAAYKRTSDPDGSSGLIAPSYLEMIAGVERPLGDRFRIQVQGYLRHFPEFTPLARTPAASNTVSSSIAELNAALQLSQFRTLPGATARIAYENEDTRWKAELFVLAYFPGSGTQTFSGEAAGLQFVARPKIAHEIQDGLSLVAGLDHPSGPSSTLFGAAKTYRSVFMEVNYVF